MIITKRNPLENYSKKGKKSWENSFVKLLLSRFPLFKSSFCASANISIQKESCEANSARLFSWKMSDHRRRSDHRPLPPAPHPENGNGEGSTIGSRQTDIDPDGRDEGNNHGGNQEILLAPSENEWVLIALYLISRTEKHLYCLFVNDSWNALLCRHHCFVPLFVRTNVSKNLVSRRYFSFLGKISWNRIIL